MGALGGSGKAPNARARFEWVILLVVLVAGTAVTLGLLHIRGKAQRSELLLRELSQLRSAVALYKTVMKANPPSLTSLAKETYHLSLAEEPRPFLFGIRPAPNGRLVDPFGHAYVYDLQNGWVHSITKGFETW